MEVRAPDARYLQVALEETEAGPTPVDWPLVRLDEIADPERPISYGVVQTGPRVQNGVPCLRVVNIQDGKIQLDDLITTSREISNAYRRTKLREGDLVVPLRGKVGECAQVERSLADANLTRGVALVAVLPKYSATYCKQFFSSSRSRARLNGSMNGSALQEIPIATLRSFKIALPPTLEEQNAIAVTLVDADALIDSLEQLLNKKRQIKQGAMQELLTGKRRLPGFSLEWNQRRLGDLLSIRHGRDQKQVECDGGEYPILATGGQIGWASEYLHAEPSVLIGRKGTIDRPRYMDTPFWSVDTLFYSEVHRPNVAKFLYYRFCLIDWMRHNEASGVPSLGAKVIEGIEISCPMPDEQQAIANVLSDLDDAITALESRLTKARALKQAMAQALLTGRIRLVEPTA